MAEEKRRAWGEGGDKHSLVLNNQHQQSACPASCSIPKYRFFPLDRFLSPSLSGQLEGGVGVDKGRAQVFWKQFHAPLVPCPESKQMERWPRHDDARSHMAVFPLPQRRLRWRSCHFRVHFLSPMLRECAFLGRAMLNLPFLTARPRPSPPSFHPP